jgi:alkanesulfonate monooxygenase SsuD/methylene tetrahydromethanopterin reductase-like flavin-dependent oxidoreductase (luciferase family)
MSTATSRTEEEVSRTLLLGSVPEIKERIAEYVEAGVQEFMLAQWPRFRPDALRQFSAEVIPAFR